MVLFLQDWRSCDVAEIVPLVDREARAWLSELYWDVAESWIVIEPARTAGRLPGLVAYDAGDRPCGWTAFLPHHGHLQVMAVAAPDASTAAVLVDGILASREAASSESIVVCARAGTPGLAGVLAARGFDVDTYRYMVRDVGAGVVPALDQGGHEGRPYVAATHDDEAMAHLFSRAYRQSRGVRAFAPGGTMAEWRSYVASLVRSTGCGWFLPELSVVDALPDSDRLRAAILMTDLGPGTAHVAQMAVDPAEQGRGLGRRLLGAALSEAATLFERVTLLVSASNTPAIDLYESMGFRDRATFVVAARAGTRSAPTRRS